MALPKGGDAGLATGMKRQTSESNAGKLDRSRAKPAMITRTGKIRGVLVGMALCLLGPLSYGQFPPTPGTGPGLPESVEAIERARVTTRILYVTAHPDDESSAVLTYLARGLHADVALLSLTRGEGGQNDLGPEQAPQLGLIRTQELLAATRGYGVKLYFTRAKDFGFSKTPEETEKVWGEQVLEDMVRVIRTFRPNVVLNGWGGVHTGHGHHQAAGLLTPKAVQCAADPSFQLHGSPSEKKDLTPWGDRKPVVILDVDRGEKPQGYLVPLDDTSSLYGKTWREIGLDAFANHRSQGIAVFLGSAFLRRPIALKREDGQELNPAILAQPLGPLDEDYEEGNMGVDPLMRAVDAALVEARDAALRLDWGAAAGSLVAAGKKLNEVPKPNPLANNPEPLVSLARSSERKREKVENALALVAGLRLEAVADRSEIVPGETFTVRVESRHREGISGDFKKPALRLPPEWSVSKEEQESPNVIRFTVQPNSRPPHAGDGPAAAILPEPPPLMTASEEAVMDGYAFTVVSPVTSVRATSTRVDRISPIVVPPYTLAVEPKQDLENLSKPRKPFDVLLRVHSYATEPGQVHVGLVAPKGWKVSAPVALKFGGTGDRYARVIVTPPQKLAAGRYKVTAYVERAADRSRNLRDERFSLSLEPLPSLPTQLWSEPALCLVHAFSVAVPQNLRVGYVTAEGEPIPDVLRQLGTQVDMLDAKDLAFGDLSRFRAIVVGVRAYELRPELPGANQRLLDYVSNGGTLVVQYNRDFVWDRVEPAPYPALISPPLPPAKEGAPPTPRQLPRITDENSPVKFLKPDDPLLNTPNKITPEDFKGWVQERGLYFWTKFDPKYTAVLAMHDPGEPDLDGGLVYAHYGKGTYIYTGLAFFRQLPDGVPGAYRLFVNLLSASRAK
ncbi:MAG TPA: PIG-L family deacetylase [Candidatus Acidoferrum sp.]|nr:PIG-L family deacetylase [Candidatus Acidoferrum sp.]